jgi:hypothetical protein
MGVLDRGFMVMGLLEWAWMEWGGLVDIEGLLGRGGKAFSSISMGDTVPVGVDGV